MSVEIFDLETYKAAFTYVGLNIKTEKIVKFVVHKDLNQSKELFDHLQTIKRQIGFNSVSFDYPILHLFLTSREIKKCIKENNPQRIIELIYNKAQEIIQKQNNPNKKEFTGIKDADVKIPQLDLFRMWHFNNKARSTSLKALEISMNFPNVMESFIPFDKPELTLEEVEDVLEYNENDVRATYEFYKRSLDKLNLRLQIREKFGINCVNYSDSKIGEELILKLYCENTFKGPEDARFHNIELNNYIFETKRLRTKRSEIALKDCIFDYIEFETPKFKELLNRFKSKIVTETKGAVDESILFKDCELVYGLGGLHSSNKSGVYKSDKDYLILDADITGMYPNIIISNRLFPEHLGEVFVDVYKKDIVDVRTQAKKEGNMVISDAMKLSSNSIFGKSNDAYSFLQDSKLTLSITVNGQLLISMLLEVLNSFIKDFTLIQVNTDGITIKINRKEIDTYYTLCKTWEDISKLNLEYVEYDKMVIMNVNNYQAISTSGKKKYKGAFEIDKELHKNNSFRIVPIALSEYFFNGVPVEETITKHRDIYDFCGRQKFTWQSHGETCEIKYDESGNPYKHMEKQQKNTRYYISNSKTTFVKKYTKGSSEIINKGCNVTIFNKFVDKPFDEYSVDFQFYVKECYKIINEIEPKQISLF